MLPSFSIGVNKLPKFLRNFCRFLSINSFWPISSTTGVSVVYGSAAAPLVVLTGMVVRSP